MSHVDETDGEIAQLVERRTHKPKVKGSIPFLATIFFFFLSNLVEVVVNSAISRSSGLKLFYFPADRGYYSFSVARIPVIWQP